MAVVFYVYIRVVDNVVGIPRGKVGLNWSDATFKLRSATSA
jgi:hypothetical protein